MPHIRKVDIDGNNVDISVSDNLYECKRLDTNNAPIMVSNIYH